MYASDLCARARDGAGRRRVHGLEVGIDRDLREKNFGTWEGLTDTEIEQQYPDAVRGRWGDGETTEQVAERATAAIRRIRGAAPAGRVLVVSHGGAAAGDSRPPRSRARPDRQLRAVLRRLLTRDGRPATILRGSLALGSSELVADRHDLWGPAQRAGLLRR